MRIEALGVTVPASCVAATIGNLQRDIAHGLEDWNAGRERTSMALMILERAGHLAALGQPGRLRVVKAG